MGERTYEKIVNNLKLCCLIEADDKKFKYKKIIFSGRTTIILWEDGTKTVVTASPDRDWDPYSGVAIAFMKKALGNKNGHRNKKIMKDIDEALEAKEKRKKNGATEEA